MKNKLLSLVKIVFLFGFIFLFIHLVHFRFFQVNVVMYSTLYDVFGALLLLLIAIKFNLVGLPLSVFEMLQAILICGLLGYVFAISIPTVIDRSLSIYILEKLQQRGGGIELDAFEQIFKEEYMVEHRLVDVRLTEQQESGTIEITEGCVKLKPRGVRIVKFTRFYRQNFLPKHRLLMGQISNDLTDPFSKSLKDTDYECE
jgi:hypothetical protein